MGVKPEALGSIPRICILVISRQAVMWEAWSLAIEELGVYFIVILVEW